MSKQANKTVIGAFVVGAIALVVAGVLIFGSGRFLTEKRSYVLYFEGSVKGLNIGAPVVFRGVKIGSVTDIHLIFDSRDLSFRIPVYIEIERESVTQVCCGPEGENYFEQVDHRTMVKQMCDRGLRAQLQTQSFVTGQLLINLDFHPDTPARFFALDSKYPEIPTIPSTIQELSKTLENLPFEKLVDNVLLATKGIERLVNAPETMDSIRSLNEAMNDARKLTQKVNEMINPLLTSIEEMASAGTATFKEAEKTFSSGQELTKQLASDMTETLEAARASLQAAEKTLSAMEGATREDSPVRYEITKTIEELSAAARSVRVMADYLERHPEALLRGKREPGGK